jgi:hypothetical protein
MTTVDTRRRLHLPSESVMAPTNQSALELFLFQRNFGRVFATITLHNHNYI